MDKYTVAKIGIHGAKATVLESNDITMGLTGAVVQLIYDDDLWQGMRKKVTFRGTKKVDVLTDENVVELPWEVTTAKNVTVSIGITGVDADEKTIIPTVWATIGTVKDSGYGDYPPPAAPLKPEWAQVVAMIGTLANLNTETRENLVAAINEVLGKVGTGGNVDLSGYVKSVNGIKPDPKTGDVAIKIPDSSQNANLASPNGTVWALAVTDDGTVYAVNTSGGGESGGDNEGEGDEAEPFSAFKFIQLSDTHYQYSQDATVVLVANINALDGVDFVTNSGDLTLENPAELDVKEAELAEVKANLIDPLNIPHYTCKGNHDISATAELWRTYTGMEELHELVHKGCAFLFLDYQHADWLDWLESKVQAHTGKRIFVFEHQNIETDDFTVGLVDGETRGRFADDAIRRILRILRNNHNIIWFTGHTHWSFGTTVNDVYNDNGLMGTIVHTPYLNAYQGWMVEVGDETTILRGVSFAESGMTYLGEGYDYTIEQDTTDYGEAEIIAEGGTATVGGAAEISVYLAAQPSGNQTVHLVAADAINIGAAELVFTPANYSTPQTVTVTGVAAGTGTLTLYSQSKTTVRKIDVVAGSATVNWFNKYKPIGRDNNYTFCNFIPAKTGDTVLSTTLGSQTSGRLRMYDADYNLIATAQDGVTAINYTIVEEGVEYVSVKYRTADGDYADTLMVTVNQELPSEYIAYNGEPVGYVITNYADADNPSLTDGYYSSSLVKKDVAGCNVSNLIPCVTGDAVYANNIAINYAYMYLYDATQAIIERVSFTGGMTIENENAAYFAVGYNNSATDVMIMKNQPIPAYYVADTDTM